VIIKQFRKYLTEQLNNYRWFYLKPLTFKNKNFSNYILYLAHLLYTFINLFIDGLFLLFIYFYNKISALFNKSNSNYKIKKIKKSCFIIGNGPSLKDIDIKKINEKYDTFVCNYFYVYNKKKIIPTFYTLTDGAYFSTNDDYRFKRKHGKDKVKIILQNIFDENSELTTFLIPSVFKDQFNKTNIKFTNKVIFFKESNYPIEEYLPADINFNRAIPPSYNVLISNLCIAISLGYKNIYLLGADQDHNINESYAYKFSSFKKKLKKYIEKKNKHKYQLNHSNTNTLGFWSTYRSFKAFNNINKYAKKNKINIYNCSTRGILDVFKHKNFYKIF
jgi:hypothetical protein